MPSSSDSATRPLAQRVLLLQAALGLAVALACLGGWGRNGFVSALAGAFTGVIANLYMTLRALAPARTPQAALGRLYFGQLTKLVVSVGLFVLAFLFLPKAGVHVVWLALLAAYLATLAASWWVTFRLVRRGQDAGS